MAVERARTDHRDHAAHGRRDGAVTIITSDARRYMAIPGRGSGGNIAVEAQWAAAWDSDES